ncbi:glycosyltransferase [Pseudomonadota bacterium]
MILHITTWRTGGAGIAAKRLHLALLKEGLPSYMLSLGGVPDPEQKIDVLPKRYLRFWLRGLGRLGFSMTEEQRWEKVKAKAGLSKISASSIRSDALLARHPWVAQANLINLHWVTGVLDWPTFFANVDKPIVWTMHDMNPFLGCFHYEVDRERAGNAGECVDRELLLQKKHFLASKDGLTCVAPSSWLSKKASNSDLLARFQHEVIPNGLDTTIFKRHDKQFARSVFDLPIDKRIVLVVSESLSNHRKGLDILIKAFGHCKPGKDWLVTAVGDGKMPIEGHVSFRNIGSIHDERLMSLLYSAVDLVVVPSREDNLPNVVLEALCCGTPVVGTPVGGLPELIFDGENGFLADDTTPAALARAIEKALKSDFDANLIRKSAVAKFDQLVQARRYKILYEKILGYTL